MYDEIIKTLESISSDLNIKASDLPDDLSHCKDFALVMDADRAITDCLDTLRILKAITHRRG